MKKYVFIVMLQFFVIPSFSQTGESLDSIVAKSLEVINKKYHYNFEKYDGQNILIIYNDSYYVYDGFRSLAAPPFSSVKVQYRLKKVGKRKYSFRLKWASELYGEFIYKKDGTIKFPTVPIKSTQ